MRATVGGHPGNPVGDRLGWQAIQMSSRGTYTDLAECAYAIGGHSSFTGL